jgi:hypothetical protein
VVEIFDIFLRSIGRDPNRARFLNHSIMLGLLLRQLVRQLFGVELSSSAGRGDD